MTRLLHEAEQDWRTWSSTAGTQLDEARSNFSTGPRARRLDFFSRSYKEQAYEGRTTSSDQDACKPTCTSMSSMRASVLSQVFHGLMHLYLPEDVAHTLRLDPADSRKYTPDP